MTTVCGFVCVPYGDSMAAVVDQTRGIYRRIYAGFLTGQRINSVSLEAEAWFWRLQAMADDFGTFSADPRLLHLQAAPRRSIDPEVAEGLLQDLARAGLVRLYSVEGYRYGSIVGFEQIQPAPKNGRRLRKYPAEPPMGNPGESGGIRIIPGESTTPHSHTQLHSHSHSHTQKETPLSAADPPRKKPPKPDAAGVPIPGGLDSPELREAWAAFLEHRRQKRAPMTERAAQMQLDKMVTWGVERAVAAIQHSVANGYTGVFEDKNNGTTSGHGRSSHREAKREREYDESALTLPGGPGVGDGVGGVGTLGASVETPW